MSEKEQKISKNAVGEEGGVRVYVTDKGSVVRESVLKQYETTGSKQLSDTMFEYKQSIDPPYDLKRLLLWMNQSVVHSGCIHAKVQDTVGIGFNLEPLDESMIENKESNADYKKLMAFFGRVNPAENITRLLKKVCLDYEACGNSYIEVARGKMNEVVALYHVNATTIKWAKTKDKFVQMVDDKKVWFKLFGNEKPIDKTTGQFTEGGIDPDKVGNEIIPIVQYTWQSAVYGMPEWLPALFPMFGDLKECEYNIDFFTNYGVPAYAVIIEGGTMTDEVEKAITKFFETTLKGSNHKTLTMSAPAGTTLRFERLSVEEKEASFRMFKKDNRDSILTAHRVPPYRAAIVEQGQLGGNVAVETDRIYLDSVINPRQSDFAWIINEFIIKQGLGIAGWEFQFEDINIADRGKEAEIHERYFNMAVLSPNEIREELGMEHYEGGDGHYLNGALINIDEATLPSDTLPAEGLTPGQKTGDEPIDTPAGGTA